MYTTIAIFSVSRPGSKMPLRAVSITGVATVAPKTTATPATKTAIRRRKIREPNTALTILAASLRPTSMQSQASMARPRNAQIVMNHSTASLSVVPVPCPTR